MKDTKEVRCVNKNGKERFISEHLTKDPQYMATMELIVEDAEEEKKHFEQTFQKLKAAEEGFEKVEDSDTENELESIDEFSEIKEEIQDAEEEKKGNKKKK